MSEDSNDETTTATPLSEAETLQRASDIIDDLDSDERFRELDEALAERTADLDDALTSLAHDLRALARVLRAGAS